MRSDWEGFLKNRIALADCAARRVYRLHARNIKLGVFDGERGFFGIRTKFGSRYIFREYHFESPDFATVTPLVDLGIDLPADIPLKDYLGSVDEKTKRPVAFDRPVADGGRGWYFLDTNEADRTIRSIAVHNDKMFDFLDEIERTRPCDHPIGGGGLCLCIVCGEHLPDRRSDR